MKKTKYLRLRPEQTDRQMFGTDGRWVADKTKYFRLLGKTKYTQSSEGYNRKMTEQFF